MLVNGLRNCLCVQCAEHLFQLPPCGEREPATHFTAHADLANHRENVKVRIVGWRNIEVMLNFRPFFFNDTATTEIYTLSLHDALPIRGRREGASAAAGLP